MTDARLVAGKPWPVIHKDTDQIIHDGDRPWIEMKDLGYQGSFIKVLYVDRETNTVAFLYNMAPGQSFPMHEHRCRVLAYTLEGEWWYDERKALRKGTTIFEDKGSTHFPQSGDQGFKAFVVLLGEPGESVLIRRQHPKTLEVIEIDIDYFARLMNEDDLSEEYRNEHKQ
jgi:quercetin dioxygenase-like cupin family protein